MIRPRQFGVNPQTSATNSFQRARRADSELAARATREVDDCAHALAAAGVLPLVFDDTAAPAKPDAVFPNNWVSFHASGRIVLYPMLALNRRAERRVDILHALTARGYRWHETIDLSELETRGVALEGTGSLVFDRPRGLAFAALSSRTRRAALAEFAVRTGYRVLEFRTAFRGQPVYHTNVMLALGREFAVICDEIIPVPAERDAVIARLEASGRDLIRIDAGQMACFGANLLELDAETGPVIALSTTALAGFRAAQRRRLEAHGRLLPLAVPAVERGGGSLRCMLAEVFLPRAGTAGS